MSSHLSQLDVALKRILSEPSWAARLLTAVAARLDNEPFLVVDTLALVDAETHAIEQVLGGLPEIVASEAEDRAAAAMPMPRHRETCGELAIRLRAIAKTI